MGDTFFVEKAVFRGHAVGHTICYWGAAASGDGAAPEGKVGSKPVPNFWCQSQNRLQVEEAFYGWRKTGIAEPVVPPKTTAATDGRPLGGATETIAQKTPGVGPQKTAGATSSQRANRPDRAHDCPLAQALEFGETQATQASDGSCKKRWAR